jgi:hypothetical protein
MRSTPSFRATGSDRSEGIATAEAEKTCARAKRGYESGTGTEKATPGLSLEGLTGNTGLKIDTGLLHLSPYCKCKTQVTQDRDV